jgi:RNA polymerase sigma factor (sigma-70 family)
MPVPQAEIAHLYAAHAARVLRWVRRFSTERDPEELVHEIFVKVIERIDQFRADSSPTTWLYRVATNHCLNRMRDEGRRAELRREHADPSWSSTVEQADQETVALLGEILRSLDAEQAEVAVYYFIDGMTHAEIARIVGCSERTVGNRLERLRKAARVAAGEEP